MRKYTFGQLLHRFRKQRQLNMKEICEGLCCIPIYNSFEKEKNLPDILLFERFLERMGVSWEEVSLMVLEKDYPCYISGALTDCSDGNIYYFDYNGDDHYPEKIQLLCSES